MSPPPEDSVSQSRMVVYVVLSILSVVGNAVTYKKMLNKYKSAEPSRRSILSSGSGALGHESAYTPHNYEFFVNQFNIVIYCAMSAVILLWKAFTARGGPRRWWRKQSVPWGKFFVMGFLDALSAFLSTMGGAFTDGSLQNLLNQCVIPATILMSFFWLRERVTCEQGCGSSAIFAGTAVSVIPAMLNPAAHSTTTPTGVIVFFLGILPCAVSNVYKEAAFRDEDGLRVDLYLLSGIVAMFQVVVGFAFVPVLALPAFGGIKFKDMPSQMSDGMACFLGGQPRVGDHCAAPPSTGGRDDADADWSIWSLLGLDSAAAAMLLYCFVNFGYNVLSLLVTKHGSAVLMVVSAALALPLTNIAFASSFFMGDDVEAFTAYDVAALVIVVLGFVLYSSGGLNAQSSSSSSSLSSSSSSKSAAAAPNKKRAKLLPMQGAGGSMMYIRERSNSDPNLMWSPNFAHTPKSSRFGRFSPATRLLENRDSNTFRNSPAEVEVLPTFHRKGGGGLSGASSTEAERTALISNSNSGSGGGGGGGGGGGYDATLSSAPIAMGRHGSRVSSPGSPGGSGPGAEPSSL